MIYLASPYSHPDPVIRDARFKDVCRVAAKLMSVAGGQLVFCPIAHSHPIVLSGAGDLGTGYVSWQEFDEHILRRACTRVYVLALDGWRESKGIAGEVAFARSVGLPVFLLDPHDLLLEPYQWS